MFIKIAKWVSLPVLLIASMFTQFASSYQLMLDVVICAGALVVVQYAFRAKEYGWAAGFVAIAIVFSPLILVFKTFFLMSFICVATFVTLLELWKPKPHLAAVESNQ